MQKFLDFSFHFVHRRYWTAFFIAVMTGMRQGEILALRWSDLDLESEHPAAFVNGTLKWLKKEGFKKKVPFIEAPKTEKSRRRIDLTPDTVKVLREYRAIQAEERERSGDKYMDLDLVVARPNGYYMYPKTFYDAWCRALKGSGLPRIRFHDLRHTHASLLLMQGVHPKIVSERLGHTNTGITLDIYSHIIPSLQYKVTLEFGGLFDFDQI